MSETVTVLHLVDGSAVEAVHVGERVTCQHFPGGLALVKVFQGGELVRGVSYAHAEVVTREYSPGRSGVKIENDC